MLRPAYIQYRHGTIALFVVLVYVPEGYQGNRRGFPWAGVRGAAPRKSGAYRAVPTKAQGGAPRQLHLRDASLRLSMTKVEMIGATNASSHESSARRR